LAISLNPCDTTPREWPILSLSPRSRNTIVLPTTAREAIHILSLASVKEHYRVTYDSKGGDTFVVTGNHGLKLHFQPTKNGLYALRGPSSNGKKGKKQKKVRWSFVTTVSDKKDLFTKRELQAAARARKVQNIIMFPSARQLLDISDKNELKNNPVQRADIKAAEDIYGSNLGALKGKTVTHKGVTVSGQITGVPPAIKNKYKSVTLCIDVMFVNKIAFLVTTSHGLHFGTVENLVNGQVPTVKDALNRVLSQYAGPARRGFRVATIHADPEFKPLQAEIGHVQFNCAPKMNVPEIERFIRTVKDRTRSRYHSLPFKCIPRLITIRLVSNCVFWLNVFPHKDGVSSTLSPRYLMTGKHLDFTKHVRAEFGAYVQTHEQHSNNMDARTIDAICLGPSGNEQGGHWFLSLSTGKCIHHHRWTTPPAPDDAIERVNTIGRQRGMPRKLTFADRFGFELTNDADDDSADDDRDSDYDPADDDSDDDADDDHDGYGADSDDEDNDNDDADDDMDEPDDPILRPAVGPTNNGGRVPSPTANGGTTGVNRTRVNTC
jgi:hypothetical protein